MSHYKKHVFFCINQREGAKRCCADASALDMVHYAKQKINALGLSGTGGIRINKSGCLGRCALGPTIVVYPEGVWYRYTRTADIDLIIEQHLLAGQVVKHLLI